MESEKILQSSAHDQLTLLLSETFQVYVMVHTHKALDECRFEVGG